jgi:Fe2+ transport system protein B
MQAKVSDIQEVTIIPVTPTSSRRVEDTTHLVVTVAGGHRPFYAKVKIWAAMQLEYAWRGYTTITHYGEYEAKQAHKTYLPILLTYKTEDDVETTQLEITYDEELIQRMEDQKKIRERFEDVTEHCRYMKRIADEVLEEIGEIVDEAVIDEEEFMKDREEMESKVNLIAFDRNEQDPGPVQKKKVRFSLPDEEV